MADAGNQTGQAGTDAAMLGDHLVMDMLNTEACKGDSVVDYWRSGEDVLLWLAQHGIHLPDQAAPVNQAALLVQAKALRTLARRMVEQRKQGHIKDIEPLNAYLDAYLSAPHLERDAQGRLALARRARGEAIASLLGPLAQALAQLLAEDDFALVKQCEHPDCILWFYDRTKAHKRRWCSMATCGNRFKAAQFRKKSSG